MATDKSLSILIVDDDSMIRSVIKIILKSDGYKNIEEASSAEAALEHCTRLKPGLVLLDINMPDKTGLEALEGILETSPTSMVLMVTGELTKGKLEEAKNKGATGFVVKPITPASLLRKIESSLQQRSPG
ncbi:MAG: response regulator [Gammaproteobacteria bacterium]|nr:response regulator [Gammaproteobacteria bacterium]MBU0788073.1 response regulator [Gammaproteobacteria bacterium]MBU0815429.1 response regulator [Gammaproteobacteria bacterium]MBU1785463.1 response regulator [Gammaproteobacteria bacterium]